MKFALWSSYTLEHWNWHTPDISGIGGSESAHIFTAQELAKRGHEVTSYIPFNGNEVVTADGVRWLNSQKAQVLPADNFWLVYRDPSFFNQDLPPGKYAFVAQDTLYTWTPEQLAKVDYYLCLCRKHCGVTAAKHPELKGRIIRWSNGIRRELIEKIEKENITRNPKKLVFASSPDRGLLLILRDWFRVREQVPDAELHVFYGMNNAEEIIRRGGGEHLKPLLGELKSLLNQPGVNFRGRISQPELIREWFSSGVFWSPTNWPETSMITIMEAQACGVVPVVNNWWAKGENCLNGVLVDGIPETDDMCRFSMLYEVLDLLKHPEKQETYRSALMEDARDTFCWGKWTKQIEELACAKA